MNHKLKVAHSTPGRIRMKLSHAKGNPELLDEVKATFSQIPGIEEIAVNPTTGSIVLKYDADCHHAFHSHLHHCCERHGHDHDLQQRPPTNEIDQLAQRIEDEAEFLAQHSQSARAVVDFFKDLDRNIKVSTDNLVDLKIVLAAGVISVTLLEVGATAATPVWVTIAIFGMNHLVEMHPRRQAEAVAVPVAGATPAAQAAA